MCNICGKHYQLHLYNRFKFTSHHWKAVINPEIVLQASSNRSLSMEANTISFP